MQSSLIIAQILGPVYVIVGLGLLLSPTVYRNIFEIFLENPATTYVGGLISLIFGLVILAFHSSWNTDWTAVVTVLGWAGLIKGALFIVCPGAAIRLYRPLVARLDGLRVWAVVPVALGLFLTAKGFALI